MLVLLTYEIFLAEIHEEYHWFCREEEERVYDLDLYQCQVALVDTQQVD